MPRQLDRFSDSPGRRTGLAVRGSAVWLLFGAFAVVVGDDSLSPVAFDWTDGRPILRDERLLVDEALAIVENSPRLEQFDRARVQLRRRRRATPEFCANPRKPIPIYEDIRQHPDDYRGQPVVLWGRVTGAPNREDGLSFRTIAFDLHDEESKPGVLVLPGEADVPPVGAAFVTVGVFLKLGADDEPFFAVAAAEALGEWLGEELTSVVEHETGPRHEERDAYFTGLVQARMADPERLRQRAREFQVSRMEKFGFRASPAKYPTFVDLFKHRDEYLGQPVTLRGHAWSITKIPAFDPEEGDEAEYGFESLYQLQLYTPHSQTNAVTVVCSELPEGLPTSGHLDEQIDGIAVTGYFFKMGRYFDQEGKGRKIPLVLARTVRWNRPTETTTSLPPWVFVVTITGVCTLIGVIAWVGYRDRRSRRLTQQRFAAPEHDMDEIENSSPANENGTS